MTCECGCGQTTPLAARTRNREGVVKGRPLRFVHGHQHRLATRRLVELAGPEWIAAPGVLDTPCHVWQRAVNAKGYGSVMVDGVGRLAHRVAYAAAHGEIPVGHEVHHRCENRRCVNAAHLEAVSPREHHGRHLTRKGAATRIGEQLAIGGAA